MKLYLQQPSRERIRSLFDEQQDDGFSYDQVGATLDWPISWFKKKSDSQVIDGFLWQFRQGVVGHGETVFRHTTELVRTGECFELGWVKSVAVRPFQQGDIYAIVAKAPVMWCSNFCRVVYVEDSASDSGPLFSVGIGTLPCHAAEGEERLSVHWNKSTDEVSFMIGSFSRPNKWISRLFSLYLRRQQKVFAREAIAKLKSRQVETEPLLTSI